MDPDFLSIVTEFFDDLQWCTTATLHKVVTAYNPITSDNNVTDIGIPVKVIVLDYVSKSEGDSTKPQTLIRTGDKQVFVKYHPSFSEINPAQDYLILAGKRYSVITVKAFNYDLSGAILYELYVRA